MRSETRSRRFKAVAKAADGNQPRRFVRLFFNLFAQPSHVNVHGPRRDKMLFPPHFLQKPLARPGGANVGQKKLEEAEFGGGQFDLALVLKDAPRGLIEAKRPQ